MGKFNKNSILTALAVFFVLGLTGPVTAFAATSPTLTGSSTYSVLGNSTVTNTGSTTTAGEVGVSTGTSITGFPPGVAAGDNTIHLHSNDLSAQAAQTDNVAAFSTLNQGCDHSYADGQDLFLLSPLGPGVYCSAGSFALSGHLTLTGSGVWIFKSASTLITSSGSSVTGGDPCNIWWRVGSSATLGTTTSLEGNILALASVTLNTGATLNGRIMAQTGAVTLDTNTISGPTCASTSATLRVIKHVVNDNGGTLLAGNFSTTITGVATAVPTAVGVEAGVDNIVTSFGAYSVDEGAHVGYDKTLDAGCSGTIAAGDTKICTITNDDQAPHLIVIKHVVNNNGGTLLAGNFSTTITGVTTAVPTAAGVEAGVDNILTSVGAYSVDEGAHVGYDKTLSAGCSGTIALGETKTCTITNDDQASHLIVIKHVVNDNTGVSVAGNFSTTITGVATAVPTAVGVEAGVDNILTSVGVYGVDEGAHVGYAKTLSAGCSGSIALGETKTCTITNDDIPPGTATLRVIKHVVNNNGGVLLAGDFSTTITGVTTAVPTAVGFEAGVDNIVTSFGAYSVDEGAHVGYDKTLDAGCSGTIAIGETKTCTITNDDQASHLIVIKHVVNDNGGTLVAGNFSTTITGVTTAVPTAVGVEAGVDNILTSVGAYSVDEGVYVGYAKTLSGGCSSTIAIGETKTCTITNDDQAPHLIVIKHVVNNNGGVLFAGSFSTTITGVTTATPTAAGVEAGVDNILTSVGAYSVDEGVYVGYAKTLSGGCSSTIAIGETKTCTITNDDIVPGSSISAGTINVVKLVINDNGGTKTVSDFPLFVNAMLVTSGVTNSLSGDSTYTVHETSDPKYAATFSGDCDIDGHINLKPNENKFCIITNNDIGPAVAISSVPPLIDLVKVPSPLALPDGPGLVKYTYTLRNIGIVPVTKITMIGDSCAPINLVSGDLNNDSTLDVNETWLYSCSTTLLATHTNTVVATGWAGGISATDIASATVVVGSSVVPPLIHVTKIPSPIALPLGGGMVTYTEKVSNPGIVALSNVKLTDDKCSPVKYISGDKNSNSKLDITETWTYTCKTKISTTTTNTATASGEANGITVRDFAIATVVVAPGVTKFAASIPGLPRAGFAPVEDVFIWSMAAVGVFTASFLIYIIRRKKNS